MHDLERVFARGSYLSLLADRRRMPSMKMISELGILALASRFFRKQKLLPLVPHVADVDHDIKSASGLFRIFVGFELFGIAGYNVWVRGKLDLDQHTACEPG